MPSLAEQVTKIGALAAAIDGTPQPRRRHRRGGRGYRADRIVADKADTPQAPPAEQPTTGDAR